VSGITTHPAAHPASARTGVATVAELVARWRPGDFLLVRGERGLLGAGAARRLEVPAGEGHAAAAARLAATLLAGMEEEACVAGALPFRADQPALLTVPERTIRAGARWRPLADSSEAWEEGGPGAFPPPAPGEPGPAESVAWRAEPSREVFAAAVAEAVRRIRAGELEKVVLARALEAENPHVDPAALLAALRRRNPAAHVYAAHAGPGSVFLGAMPETVVRRSGDAVLSIPHAGTLPRSSDPEADRAAAQALLASPKERHEHRVVVEAVAEALRPYCSTLEVEPEPHLAATQRVWHLATTLRGRLRPSAPGALGLAAALHPTPAVCGHPTARALALIDRLEPGGRGLYAGLVGWMDGRGYGEWAVSLRCALLTPERIRLHAGVGVVAQSDPAAEVAETTAKFGTLLDALADAVAEGRGGAAAEPPR
jgi:isochorismate synthase